MYKTPLHKYKLTEESNVKVKTHHDYDINPKSVVDINILLNRVRLQEKYETKRKIIFFSFTILMLFLFGAFLTFVK
tara:strand:+ start:191 stop:418 length:228 start_codon:yes stop_codon:yes gene_type:complete